MSKNIQVIDDGDSHRYYWQTPNMIDDADLDPYEFRLLLHLRRVAGDKGRCWQSTETLAEACHMSVGKISEAKESLMTKGFVEIHEEKASRGSPLHVITLVDLWPENMEKYSSKGSCGEPDDDKVHVVNLIGSCGETKNNPIKNNDIPISSKKQKKLGVPPTTPELSLYPLANALAEVCCIDFTANKSILFREAKLLNKDAAEVRNQYGRGGWWYRGDFRGRKGDPPALNQVRQTWGRWEKSKAIAVDDGSRYVTGRNAEILGLLP